MLQETARDKETREVFDREDPMQMLVGALPAGDFGGGGGGGDGMRMRIVGFTR